MPVASWLFIRDGESIWIERHGFSLLVAGPGDRRSQVAFFDESALQQYQIDTAERLSRDGWLLWGFDQERRQGERRAVSRDTAERRVPSRRP